MARFVLVHGAFNGAWYWRGVTRYLRAEGHGVTAPTLTGSGERFHLLSRETSLGLHVEDVVQHLTHEVDGEVILVGHSYGGAVVEGVATRSGRRAARLVFLDAVAPRDGESTSGTVGPEARAQLKQLAGDGEGWLLQPFPPEVYGVTEPALVALLATHRHAHPMRTLVEALSLGGPAYPGKRIYLRASDHASLEKFFGADPLAAHVARAERDGFDLDVVPGPHDAPLTDAEAVATALMRHAG
jgi:pimeloyl-ACP methyl ester carboxylesterase